MGPSRRQWLASLPLVPRVFAQDVSFSADVKLINLFATVRDQRGRVVQGLTREDFEVFEDERRQTIRHFSAEAETPLRIGLLVDVSGSMSKRLSEERVAAHRFFQQVLRADRDFAFVVRFDQLIEVLQPRTANLQDLNRAADELTRHRQWPKPQTLDRPAARGAECRRGSSAIRDAVFVVSQELLRKERGRKALILLSDGMDQGSCVILRATVEAAQRADAIVYTVLLPERKPRREMLSVHPGVPLMQQLAARTGGRMFAPGVDTTVAKAFATIEEDLRHQYSIGYTSDAPSPGFHQIRLATRQSHAVQAREGYYGN